MDPRIATICFVLSLLHIYTLAEEKDIGLLSAQDLLMTSGIGVDLESSHIEDLRESADLPKAYQKVIDNLHLQAETCNPQEEYRRADGVCNNLKNPLQGAVLHFQKRLLPNAYMDGMAIPRMVGKNNFYLASPRKVSLECFPPNEETVQYLDKTTTQMSMQWGQYIDHDLVFTEVMPGANCCSDPRHTCVHPDTFIGGPCFPIGIAEDDRYFNDTCMNFKRSFAITVKDVREQISGVTSFVDASTVYGSNAAQQGQLRTHDGGLLKVTAKNTLPHLGPFKCRKDIPKISHCPYAGDVRVNVFPGLTLVHLLFVREHNRLAKALHALNPKWKDERIFQEARKIVVAFHQKITYEEFLPHVIGDDAMYFFGLTPNTYKYDSSINPSILNEFAVAAFRYGHSQINGLLNNKHISETYFQPWEAMDTETDVRNIMKEQCKKPAHKTNHFFSKEVNDLLFLDVDAPGHSTDLGARNVQRGRDHGVPSYMEYLDLALKDFIKAGNISFNSFKMAECLNKNVYDSANDVDLFVGGLSETPMNNALVGPTFSYIIGEQFRRLKFGDRFFFETDDPVVGFSKAQLQEIKKQSLAHIICRNTDNTQIQPDVFSLANSKKNPNRNCKTYKEMDLAAWKEEEGASWPPF